LKILREYTPLVEQASIDEAYMDATDLCRQRLESGPDDAGESRSTVTRVAGESRSTVAQTAGESRSPVTQTAGECRSSVRRSDGSAGKSRQERLRRLAVELALGQSNSPRVAEIDTRLEALQKELLKKANAKQGFEELADEIDALREEKQDLLVEDANRAAMKQRLDELEEFLDEHQEPVTDYDEGMVRRLIERITVYEDHLDFEFKSGLETEVQM
jgi:hypothetical protein